MYDPSLYIFNLRKGIKLINKELEFVPCYTLVAYALPCNRTKRQSNVTLIVVTNQIKFRQSTIYPTRKTII